MQSLPGDASCRSEAHQDMQPITAATNQLQLPARTLYTAHMLPGSCCIATLDEHPAKTMPDNRSIASQHRQTSITRIQAAAQQQFMALRLARPRRCQAVRCNTPRACEPAQMPLGSRLQHALVLPCCCSTAHQDMRPCRDAAMQLLHTHLSPTQTLPGCS